MATELFNAVAELEANIRHATAPLDEGTWRELDTFLDGLQPAPEAGGEVL